MSITHINSLSELNNILSKSGQKVTVIDFHATWCGPCHAIAPTFESLSKQYKTVNFLKCDVDAVPDVAGQYKVTAMPTFIFLKGTTKVDQVRGADKGAIESALRKHAASSTAAFSGRGQTLGGGAAPVDVSHEVNQTINNVNATFTNLDPQVKVLLALLGAYALFWYLS